jgi:dihydropteroate synthase
VPNARVLTVAGGASSRERFAQYLSEARIAEAANAADASAIVVDAAGSGAGELAAALREAGASAWCEGGRLVVAGTREAFSRARASSSGAAHELGGEVLRAFDADRNGPPVLRLRDRSLDFGERARVMGILNVTPNSPSDLGRYSGEREARERAAEMVAQGADIIDVGGQSYSGEATAPDEELGRVLPIVRALVADGLGVPISVDTFRSSVAEPVLAAGAHLINDCSGLSDERMAGVVARAGAGLVVMHLKGRLNVRDPNYPYDDVMGEILEYLRERTDRARAAGVCADAIVVDPGLEFGKEPATDLEILERFGDLRSLGYPILLAASRKRFIGRIFNLPIGKRLIPSLATAALGIAAGARLVRVHDVAETVAIARTLGVTRAQNRARVVALAEAPEET